MNIYQRIVLVVGGIALAVVIFITLETTHTSRELLEMQKATTVSLKGIEAAYLLLKNDCIIAIIKSAIVAALTFSAYVGLGLIPRKKKHENQKTNQSR